MNKYKKLASNTLIFSIGTFSSKLLVFLLMPLYTRILTHREYGDVDILIQSANLLIPLVSVGVADGIIRFGLDSQVNKNSVFTSGLVATGIGFGIFLLFIPVFNLIPIINEYSLLLYLYVLTGCLRSLCVHFVRAKQYTRLYAFDGLFCTVMVIVFNILFLVVFRWGAVGYTLATICSDFCSVVFLFQMAKLKHFIHFRHFKKSVLPVMRSMLKYCIPMIPANIFWWVTNVSDRYAVTYLISRDENGLYAIAYKVPTMITIVSTIFIEAWQISAVSEKDSPHRSAFFSKVMNSYQSVVFLLVSGAIVFCKVLIKILGGNFYESWRYVPILVIATGFSCMSTFLGSVYIVEKKSSLALLTTFIGAVSNVALNFALIPFFKVNGAALATLISYMIVYIIRLVNTRKLIQIHVKLSVTVINFLIVALQSYIMIMELPYWILWESLLFLLMILVNLKPLVVSILKIIHK